MPSEGTRSGNTSPRRAVAGSVDSRMQGGEDGFTGGHYAFGMQFSFVGCSGSL